MSYKLAATRDSIMTRKAVVHPVKRVTMDARKESQPIISMNKDLTDITFLLDRSGSMSSHLKAAIDGFNGFLREQKDTPGNARFTLILFNDGYEVTCPAVPIREVVDLDQSAFVPGGSTALLDAIGRTIGELGARLASMPEHDRPGQVIVAILTDGEENSSLQFTLADISSRIAHQRDVYNWQFFFLAADQDAIATAAAMNIGHHAAMRFNANDEGFDRSSKVISRKMRSMRKSIQGAPLSVQEEQDLKASLSDIGRDEDRRGKGK